MIDIEKLVSGGLVKLYNSVDNTTASPVVELYPAEALKYQVDNTPANNVLLTEIVVTLSANKVNSATFELESERFYLTGGAEVTKPDGTVVVQYSGTNIRGLSDIHKNNPPTAAESYAVNYIAHAPESVACVPEDWLIRYLNSVWKASSSQDTGVMGEAANINQIVSLHTDGKLYKYHNVNYPDVQGMLTAGFGNGATATYTNLRGLHTGLVGLTANSYVYAENGVEYTQTPSATTTIVGKSKGTTAALLAFAVPMVAAASKAQMEAGTAQGVYADPIGVAQAVQAGGAQYAADAVGTDSYAITLSPAPTEYTTGMRIFMKAGTANTGACTLNVNALGAKAIKKNVSEVLENGDIAVGQIVELVYDGTNFQIVGPISGLLKGIVAKANQSITRSTDTEQHYTIGGASSIDITLEDSSSDITISGLSFATGASTGITIDTAGLYLIKAACVGTGTANSGGSTVGTVHIDVSNGILIGGVPTGQGGAATSSLITLFSSGTHTSYSASSTCKTLMWLNAGCTLTMDLTGGQDGSGNYVTQIDSASISVDLIQF